METDFKTSHVIVYRRSFGKGRSCNYISKHLMLLFITFGLPVLTFLASFQNISCYCLSTNELYGLGVTEDFKTSHVIVYLWCEF